MAWLLFQKVLFYESDSKSSNFHAREQIKKGWNNNSKKNNNNNSSYKRKFNEK